MRTTEADYTRIGRKVIQTCDGALDVKPSGSEADLVHNGLYMFESVNVAKRWTRAYQMHIDGALGRGCIRATTK